MLLAAIRRKLNDPFAPGARAPADTACMAVTGKVSMIASTLGAASAAPISVSPGRATEWSLGGPPAEPEHPQQDPPPPPPRDPGDPSRPQQPEVPPVSPHTPTLPEPRMLRGAAARR